MDNTEFNNENKEQNAENTDTSVYAHKVNAGEAEENTSSENKPYGSYGTYGSFNANQYTNDSNRYNDGARGEYYGYNGNYGQYYEQKTKEPKKKQGASKGFVALMLCLSVILSGVVGFYAGVYALKTLKLEEFNFNTGSVVVDYAQKDDDNEDAPVITGNGDSAYVASIAADAVVEVRTEIVTTGSYFGQYVEEGAGSGVIIDSTGYIITCAHVIEDASKITVKLTNGDTHTAELIGSDPQTDIAVIKINVKNIKHAVIGDSDKLITGQHVVAIGNPLGELGGTVTDGIISATNREIAIGSSKYNLLQTNAAINPGNSGGGLFDDDGNLIGIVNAKSTGDSIEGLGFAIPINDAMNIAENLIENGYISGRVKLGFELLLVDSSSDYRVFLQYGNIIDGYGIYIITSESDKFVTGDKLIAIDGYTLSDLTTISTLLLEYEPGDVVTVTVSRKNQVGRREMIQLEHTLMEKTAVDYQ